MNIAYRIRQASREFPEKKSVVFARDNSFFTFKEFEDRSNQLANQLIKFGIKRGMRTLLFITPRLDFSVITFALFKVGAVPVLIDPAMGMKSLLRSIRNVKPEAIVSVGKVHWLRRILPKSFASLKVKISVDPVGGRTHYLYKNLSSCAKDFTPAEVMPEELAAILFTSGGTGIPKGVLYTHGVLNFQTDALKKMFSLTSEEKDLPGFPLFALFTLAMGMTSVIPELDPTKPASVNPEKIVKNIVDHDITFVAGSPAIWERVGKYCLKNKIKLFSVKYVVMFGAPVRLEIHQMFKEILENGDTYTPYGATECLPVSLISGSEILRDFSQLMSNGHGTCIGLPIDGVQVKVVKDSDIPERVHFLQTGQIGEIIVSSPGVTSGYFDMPKEDALAKILYSGNLWHRMGDLGKIDEHGRLWFMGRKAHKVDTGATIYYPIQVESIFNQHKAIKRSALVKLITGSKVIPAVVIERHDKRTTMDKIFFEELKALAEKHELTREIHHFFLHSSFPVDVRHNIKIDRIKLSRWAQNYV